MAVEIFHLELHLRSYESFINTPSVQGDSIRACKAVTPVGGPFFLGRVLTLSFGVARGSGSRARRSGKKPLSQRRADSIHRAERRFCLQSAVSEYRRTATALPARSRQRVRVAAAAEKRYLGRRAVTAGCQRRRPAQGRGRRRSQGGGTDQLSRRQQSDPSATAGTRGGTGQVS